jgi:O-antigen/teichoic acid export membrane protein
MTVNKIKAFQDKINKTGLQMVLSQRIWQGLSGLITVFILTYYLSPIEQGWYYSLLSLATLYIIFDFGLSNALIQIMSHLFVDQGWISHGEIKGNKAKEISELSYQLLRFYLILFLIFILLILPFGFLFFGHKTNNEVMNWQAPWIALVVSAALNLITLPFAAIFEGSGEVKAVYKLRLLQGISASIAAWVVIINGFALWGPATFFFVSVLVFIFWIFKYKFIFIKKILQSRSSKINWISQIWPIHWRVGISWISTYFFTQSFVPILFYAQNAELAGQMGLSLTLANMLALIAQSWIAYQVPDMAKAAASKNWNLLDQIFKDNLLISTGVYVIGALIALLLYFSYSSSPYIERLLSPIGMIGLLFIVLINHIIGCFITHLRSYKKEPLAWVLFLGTLIALPLMLIYSSRYAEIGMVAIVLFIQIIFIIPATLFLWKKYNLLWRL